MNKKYPLVTSYILCYKKFDYLYESIYSILNQDYPFIELIISDDASGNFPAVEIKNYIESNKKENLVDFKIIVNEKNLGTVRNLNRALKAGNGEYFIGLSGDDVFYDCTVMRRIVDRLNETGNEILCCRRLRCTEKGLKPLRMMPNKNYLKIIHTFNTPEKQFRAFAIGQYYEMASGSATYFSKNHLEKWGYFDEAYVLWEDGPFYAQYTRAGNIIPTAYDIISVKYRKGGISDVGKPNTVLFNDYVKFINNECYRYIERFNWIDQRYILFLYQRAHKWHYSMITKGLLYFKYMDVVIRKLYYKYYCLLISAFEIRKIKRLNFK